MIWDITQPSFLVGPVNQNICRQGNSTEYHLNSKTAVIAKVQVLCNQGLEIVDEDLA